MRIILFGKAGVGKNTVADFLVDGRDFKAVAFASYLKGISMELFFYNKQNRDNRRTILQQAGEAMREIYQDCWADKLMREIGGKDNIVITDCRYPNEYRIAVKDHGFLPVNIICDRRVRQERLKIRDGKVMSETEMQHLSEQLVADYVYQIDNSGSMEKLEESVDTMFKTLSTLENWEVEK